MKKVTVSTWANGGVQSELRRTEKHILTSLKVPRIQGVNAKSLFRKNESGNTGTDAEVWGGGENIKKSTP